MINHTENRKIILVIIILALLVGGIILIRRERQLMLTANMVKNAGNLPEISKAQFELIASQYLQPAHLLKKTGEVFSLDVVITAPGRKLDGADTIIKYDPKMVEVTDIKQGQFFTNYPRKTIDKVNGLIKMTGFSPKDANANGDNFIFFTIEAKALASGTAKFDFEFEKGRTNLSTVVERKTSRNLLGTVKGTAVSITGKLI